MPVAIRGSSVSGIFTEVVSTETSRKRSRHKTHNCALKHGLCIWHYQPLRTPAALHTVARRGVVFEGVLTALL